MFRKLRAEMQARKDKCGTFQGPRKKSSQGFEPLVEPLPEQPAIGAGRKSMRLWCENNLRPRMIKARTLVLAGKMKKRIKTALSRKVGEGHAVDEPVSFHYEDSLAAVDVWWEPALGATMLRPSTRRFSID
ncbi:MAG: hypothetical protein M1832_006389 [Thelocarpon impressellum]|nr:MAG: hypothetical protein M1832_006389 [Thelocarpon impressellum]